MRYFLKPLADNSQTLAPCFCDLAGVQTQYVHLSSSLMDAPIKTPSSENLASLPKITVAKANLEPGATQPRLGRFVFTNCLCVREC